jgi:hypothetical protein
MTHYQHKVYFSFKNSIFVTQKSDQDPDGSAMVWLPGSGSALRLKAVSGSAMKPMQIEIHNTSATYALGI